MGRVLLLLGIAAFVAGCGSSGSDGTTPTTTHGLRNIFFLHHSVGYNLIEQGSVRATITAYNTSHGTTFAFWDHGYNADGLRNANGDTVYDGAQPLNYGIPDDNTDPEGFHLLWTSGEDRYVKCRHRIMQNHQVIVLKSCFPTNQIESDQMLEQYRTWYRAMRVYFDAHPDHLFIVVTPPPLIPSANDAAWARRARDFANWLKSADYLSGHPNVRCFDLFDYLANPDDGSATANMLRATYQGDPNDSHPNELANQTVGPIFANFLCTEAAAY